MKRALAALILVLAVNPSAAQKFGDWKVSPFDGGSSAITTNDSADEFGYVCFEHDEKCLWVMALANIQCEQGADYPVLVNAHSGATHMQLTCLKLEAGYFMVFKDYSQIQLVVNENTRIGIAFPMVDGMFRVLRFSLVGALPATSGAEQKMKSGKRTSTRTQVL